ncbi:MAG: hypothetical protein IJG24_01865 [Selenomonadaceae bacterium]|nr:hypothetical protein [Selenomonadaceae bacterium]
MKYFLPHPDVVPLMIAALALIPATVLGMILHIVTEIPLVPVTTLCFLILYLIGYGVFAYYEEKIQCKDAKV